MRPFLLLGLLALLVLSCSKDKDSGGTTTPPDLLRRSVTRMGTDSFQYRYSYDASQRLTAIDFLYDWGSTDIRYLQTIARNSVGMIESITYSGPGVPLGPLQYRFRHTGKRYTSGVVDYVYGNSNYSDSTVYHYNSAGQIDSAALLQKMNNGAYFKSSLVTYSYSTAGNLTGYKYFSYVMGNNSYQLNNEYSYDLDGKVNPLSLGHEGILVDEYELVSPSNMTRFVYTDHSNASNNSVTSKAYLYNSRGKPLSATTSYPNATLTLQTDYEY